MTKIKKTASAIVVIATLLTTIFSLFSVPVSAAKSSCGTATQVITVTTRENWWIPGAESITLKQTKGLCEKTTTNWLTRKKNLKQSKVYATWTVSVKATDGSDNQTKTLNGASLKIKLKPNKTYTITVKWKRTLMMVS